MQTLKEYTNELYEENNTLWEDKEYWKRLAEKRKAQLQQKENIIKEVREYITSQKLHKIQDTTGALTYREIKLLEILNKENI